MQLVFWHLPCSFGETQTFYKQSYNTPQWYCLIWPRKQNPMLPNTIVSNLIQKLSNKRLSGHTLSIKNDACFPQSGKGLRYLIFQMIQVAIHQFCLSPGRHSAFWINDNFYSSVYYCSSNHIGSKTQRWCKRGRSSSKDAGHQNGYRQIRQLIWMFVY